MSTSLERIVLGSTSPRRAALLGQLGIEFDVIAPAVDESRRAGEDPVDYALRLAAVKCASVRERAGPARVVLAADTVVVCAGRVLGKPGSRAEGLAMLALLSGREHRVVSAVAVGRQEEQRTRVSETLVAFRQLTGEEREAYWESGEPRDKAGGYGIQGLGSIFVTAISGSYSGVVGLPLMETAELLGEFGIDCLQRARAT